MDKILIKAKILPSEISFLVQIMEGHSHIGVVTTTSPQTGEVVVQVTPDTFDEAMKILTHLPLEIEFLS